MAASFNRAALLAVLAIAVVAFPTYYDLAQTVWETNEQSHGPVVLAVALWLLWGYRRELAALPESSGSVALGSGTLGLAFVFYVLGRSQAIVQAEAVGLLLFIAAAILLLRGLPGLRVAWFALFFLLFTIPLPGVLVQALTLPLKLGVSYVAEGLLHSVGYPVGRSGVILVAGPYNLLVADACAGLTTMFTLEAFGLLYLHIVGYTSKLRNVFIALAVLPCAFIANVVRVCVLVLVTYHFGSEAGAGFIHGFAGIVLFVVAMILLLLVDAVLGRVLGAKHAGRKAAPKVSV